jgi:hypothetical protein
LRLLEQHERRPDQGVTLDEVVAAGWPGETLLPGSAAQRVYTAVRTLRRLGLGAGLLTRDDGYLLDPRLVVRRAEGQ